MNPPSVSVVIPVRNEAAAIERAVASCLAQTYRGPLEVVVADGMSSDGTRDVLERINAGDGRVRVVDNPSRTTPSALNRAIDASSGEVIVRCDAHAELPADYIDRAVARLEATGAANVGGVQRAVGTTLVQRAIALAMSSPLGVGDARYRYGGKPGESDTVYLGVFRREPLARVGGFDESLLRNQDYELNFRLRRAGEIVWFDPELQVDYQPRSSLRALGHQYFDYGVGKRRMLRKHPKSLRWRQLAPPTLLVGLAASGLAAALGWSTIALIVPAAYVAALTLGTLVALGKAGGTAAAVYPAAVVVMHVSWGGGFLVESVGLGPQAMPR